MMFVDSHAHLTDEKYGGDISEIIGRYRAAKVGAVVNSGADILSTEKAALLSEKYDDMYFTAGIHPDDAKMLTDDVFERLKNFAKRPKCVGIGEIGYDFHWNKSTEEEQTKAFEKQLDLAFELSLPVVIHSREATKKTLDFLSAKIDTLKNGFLLHCFSESAEVAKIYADMGAYFSFGGVITFKNAKKEEVIKAVPTDRLLTETDSPYLSPEPYRGQTNEPSRIPIIAKKIADIKEIELSEAEKIIETNFKRFYRV